MLGRRQLREKVLQSIYALQNTNNDTNVVEKNMYKAIDEIYDLYILSLNLVVQIKKLAEHKIELAKQKKLPTQEDLNPNYKFVNNPILKLLEKNLERSNYTEKNKQLEWDNLDSLPISLFKEIQKSDEFKTYMNNSDDGFGHHKEFILKIYEEFIADGKLNDWVEEIKLHWSSDLHISNTMVYNTIKSLTPKSNEQIKLFKTYKNLDDKEFTTRLFNETINHKTQLIEHIERLATNWEIERIAKLDLIILQMALTEFIYFPSIPPKVTMNEYIELAKHFSTEKSKIFINGILDRYLKDKVETP